MKEHCTKLIKPIGLYVKRMDKSKYDHVRVTVAISTEPDYILVYKTETYYLDNLTEEQNFLIRIFEEVNNKLLESFGVKPFDDCEIKSRFTDDDLNTLGIK